MAFYFSHPTYSNSFSNSATINEFYFAAIASISDATINVAVRKTQSKVIKRYHISEKTVPYFITII